ncbi:FecR family protein [Catenovulum sp. SX2]|uniref:FecR family protein n=1 Tax=Catenovulum sp. SX2 TaxID=3398614 RepID=UPI003F869A5D
MDTNNNVVSLASRTQILDEAALWVIRQEEGLTAEQQQQFDLWIAQSALHRQLYQQIEQPIAEAEMLASLADIFPYQKQQAQKAWFSQLPVWSLPSVLLLVLSVVLWPSMSPWLLGTNATPLVAVQQQNYNQSFQTQVGQQQQIKLPDGSKLLINTLSQVQVVYNSVKRFIYLEQGELHIDVAHNPKWPLEVIAAGKVLTAVGTAFNVVLADGKQVELIVTDGKVGVATEKFSPPVLVRKGEKALIASDKDEKVSVEKSVMPQQQLSDQLSWQSGTLTFSGESLAQVTKELSRYTGYQFSFAEDSLKQTQIVARLKVTELDDILTMLNNNFDVQANYISDKHIQLTLKDN